MHTCSTAGSSSEGTTSTASGGSCSTSPTHCNTPALPSPRSWAPARSSSRWRSTSTWSAPPTSVSASCMDGSGSFSEGEARASANSSSFLPLSRASSKGWDAAPACAFSGDGVWALFRSRAGRKDVAERAGRCSSAAACGAAKDLVAKEASAEAREADTLDGVAALSSGGRDIDD